MIRIMACSMGSGGEGEEGVEEEGEERGAFLLDKVAEPTCWHLDQLGPGIRQPIWHTGGKWPSLWTKAPFGTWQGMDWFEA